MGIQEGGQGGVNEGEEAVQNQQYQDQDLIEDLQDKDKQDVVI